MNEIFGSIFGIFQNVYGIPLANFLFEDGRIYSQTGIAMMCVCVAVAFLFYYVIDHPALNSWQGWGLSNGVSAVICFLIAWLRVLDTYNAGLMVETELSTGESVPIAVSTFDLFNFGIAVAIISVVFYTIVSLAIKRKSVNCSYFPHIKKY